MLKLPCINCGNNLSIVKGAVVQCFNCGTKNIHYDSFDLLSHFVQEVFGYPKIIEQIEDDDINEAIIDERTKNVDVFFNEYLNEINSNDYLVITKIFPTETGELQISSKNLSKNLGMLQILIDSYLIPHIKGRSKKKQYNEYSAICEIYQLAILGLTHSIEAKENFKTEISTELYERARWNFEKAVEKCINYSKENENLNFRDEQQIFNIASIFSSILKDILVENPTHFSDKFEELAIETEKVVNPKTRVLKNDIAQIYILANELPTIFEEIRVIKPINKIDFQRERIIYHSEEIKEQLINSKKWIEEIQNRYKEIQNKILKLHSGQLLSYLKQYRQEFQKRVDLAIETFNKLIGKIIQTTLLDYTLSITDYLEEIDSSISLIHLNSTDVLERIRYIKKDIITLDDEIKNFLLEIITYGINRNLQSEYSLSIITSISDKHSSFDRMINKYIKNIIDDYIAERDEKRYTMEEQKDKYNLKIKPIIENIVRESFTLKYDEIAHPLFIEVLILSTQMEVEKEYKVFFVVDNPSSKILNKLTVSFFVPNSFRIKTRFFEIKKLKPGQKINVETRIIPEKAGLFHFMAMLEYEFSKELFWMPSLKFKLKVLDSEDLSINLDEDKMIDEIYKKYGKVANEDQLSEENMNKSEGKNHIDTEYINQQRKDSDLLPDLD